LQTTEKFVDVRSRTACLREWALLGLQQLRSENTDAVYSMTRPELEPEFELITELSSSD